MDGVVRGFARLDGYNVKLRTAEVTRQEAAPPKARSWTAPVRGFVEEPAWSGVDGDDCWVCAGTRPGPPWAWTSLRKPDSSPSPMMHCRRRFTPKFTPWTIPAIPSSKS